MSDARKSFLQMTPAERAQRALEKREKLLTFLSAAVIVDRELVARVTGTGPSAALKLLNQLLRDGQIIAHELDFTKKHIYSLSPIGLLEFGGFRFDPRRSATQVNHLLGLAWLCVNVAPKFDRWISDRELRDILQKRTSNRPWEGIPDAVGIKNAEENKRASVSFYELELNIKSNARRAKFYWGLLTGNWRIMNGGRLDAVTFICPTRRRAEGLARQVGNVIVLSDLDYMPIRNTNLWPQFHFVTLDEIRAPAVDY